MQSFTKKLILLQLPLLILITSKASGHGNGAPSSRCDTMTPGHWISSQTVPSPFQVFVDRENVTEGDRVIISLLSADGHDGFKGFLIMVKKPGMDSANYGEFDLQRSDLEMSQPLTCFNREGSAMTHIEPTEKRFVHLEWIAPKVDGDEEIFEARATIVQNFWTIWTNLTAHNAIRVKKALNSSARKPVEIKKVVHYRESITLPKSGLIDIDENHSTEPINANLPSQSPGNKKPDGDGSWAHFRKSWTQFMQRIGF